MPAPARPVTGGQLHNQELGVGRITDLGLRPGLQRVCFNRELAAHTN